MLKKIRSDKHRRFVASQPCLVTGRIGDDIHPHHLLRVYGKAMGTKSCDSWCVPLHYTIHNALHKNGNEIVFFENHGIPYDKVKDIAVYYASISPDKRIRDKVQIKNAIN